MKTELFSIAISNRNQVKFLYSMNEFTIEPYYLSREKTGKKVIYGKLHNASEIRKFEYDKIVNIRILKNKRFSPIIPIM